MSQLGFGALRFTIDPQWLASGHPEPDRDPLVSSFIERHGRELLREWTAFGSAGKQLTSPTTVRPSYEYAPFEQRQEQAPPIQIGGRARVLEEVPPPAGPIIAAPSANAGERAALPAEPSDLEITIGSVGPLTLQIPAAGLPVAGLAAGTVEVAKTLEPLPGEPVVGEFRIPSAIPSFPHTPDDIEEPDAPIVTPLDSRAEPGPEGPRLTTPVWSGDPQPRSLWKLAGRILDLKAERVAGETRWSIADLADWETLGMWATEFANRVELPSFHYLDSKGSSREDIGQVTGLQALGLAFAALSACVGRSIAGPDSLWPEVAKALPPGLKERLLDDNDQPRPDTKRAMLAASKKFNLRRESMGTAPGHRAYVNTVHLQYGIGRGWRNVSKHHAPIVLTELTNRESANYSEEFVAFWDAYLRYRGGAIDLDEAWERIRLNPWTPPGGREAIADFAAQQDDGDLPRQPRLFEEPQVTWKDEKPYLRIALSPGCGQILDGDKFRFSVAGDGRPTPYAIERGREDPSSFVFVGPRGSSREIDLDLTVEPIDVRVRTRDNVEVFRDRIDATDGETFAVFRGEVGFSVDPDESAPDNQKHTLLFRRDVYSWKPDGDFLERRGIGENWVAIQVRTPACEDGGLFEGDHRAWPASIRSGGSAEGILLDATCAKAHWGELADVSISPVPAGLEPVRFRILGAEYAAERTGPDRAGTSVPMSPELAEGGSRLAPRLDVWDRDRSRRRVLRCRWNAPGVEGYLISKDGVWRPLKPRSQRTELVGSRIRWIGDDTSRRYVTAARQLAAVIAPSGNLRIDFLPGWGERVMACTGPNEIGNARLIVKEVHDSGEIEHLEWGAAQERQCRIRFRSEFEHGAAHRVEVWMEGNGEPSAAPLLSSQAREWTAGLPRSDGAVMGVAVFSAEQRIGSRWKGDSGIQLLRRAIEHAEDWGATLRHLVRWKAPLLSERLSCEVSRRCLQHPVETFSVLIESMWAQQRADLAALHYPLVREFLSGWNPDANEAAAAVEKLLGEDIFGRLSDLRTALAADPVLTAALIIRGISEHLRLRNPTLDELVACARQFRAISLLRTEEPNFSPGDGEVSERIAREFERACQETGCDSKFLENVVLQVARQRALPWFGNQRSEKNADALRYCLGSSSACRWIAATLLDDFAQHLLKETTWKSKAASSTR